MEASTRYDDPKGATVWSPNRVVALLTPILASLAGAIGAWVADNVPGGPSLDEGELTAAFIAIALAVVAMAWKWIEGWQKDEAREAAKEQGVPIGELLEEHGGVTDAEAGVQ